MKQEAIQKSKSERKRNTMSTYNEFKEFEGKKYTGMKVGRSHKWYYDKGEWKEKKITRDQWEFNFSVGKKRVGQAPEGVPVGTEYH
jgi:adenosine deaminase